MSTRAWRLTGAAASTTAILTAILGPWHTPAAAATVGASIGAIAVSLGALGIVLARRPLPQVTTTRCGPEETVTAVEVPPGALLDTTHGPVRVLRTRTWADRDGNVTVALSTDGGALELPAVTAVTIRRP